MTEKAVRIPSLYGGISKQPAHVRHLNQVEDATNARFTVVDGMSNRAGSELITEVTGLADAENYRLHAVNRDADTQYLFIYGNSQLKAYEVDGTALTVNIDADANTYLTSGTPTADDLRFATNADYTLIANTKVTLATTTSTNYAVARAVEDADIMFDQNPAHGDYLRARDATTLHTKGYWKYDIDGDGTFAKWVGPLVGSGWHPANDEWPEAGKNSMGFKITFKRADMTIAAGAWATATKTLTKVAAFASYTFEAGDYINVTGGTNVVAGWYEIASRVDDDSITLESEITSGSTDESDVTTAGTGKVYDNVSWNMEGDTQTSMDGVAHQVSNGLHDAGAHDATCYWADESTTGRLCIMAPYKGSEATVVGIDSPTDSTLYDISAHTPFAFASGSATAGTGSPASDNKSLLDRWTQVAAPNQAEAALDNTTCPVKAVKSGSTITVSLIDWEDRLTGDKDSNPPPSLWDDSRTLSDISFHRDRLVLAGDENIVFSQAGDFFNFWIGDVETLVDADPIDTALSSPEVTIVDRITPFRKSLVILTKAGRQFELNAPETLSPDTVAITPSTSYDTVSVQPVEIGSMLYFVGEQEDTTRLHEYFYDDSRVSNTAADVTAHVFGLLPTSIKSIAASANNNQVLVLPTDGNDLFVYEFFWSGQTKDQSAWTKYEFDSGYVISDAAVMDDTAYMLVNSGTDYFLEKMPMAKEAKTTGWPYVVHLDRRQELTGVFNGVDTVWTSAASDTTLDAIVLGPDFPGSGASLVSAEILAGAGRMTVASNGATNRPMTWAAWINLTSGGGVAELANYAVGVSASIYIFWVVNGIRLDVTHGGGTHTQTLISAGAVPENEWVHVAWRWESDGTTTFYVNGVSVDADSITETPIAADSFGVGTDDDGTAGATDCLIAHVAEWTSALSPAQILALAGGASPASYSPARYWYDLTGAGPHAPASGSGSLIETGTVGDGATDPPTTALTWPAATDVVGTIKTPTSVSGTSVTLTGNWSAGECIVGRSFTTDVELTRPYVRDGDGAADFDAWVTQRQLNVAHKDSGTYTLKSTMTSRTDRTKTYTASGNTPDARGYTRAWFNGNAEDQQVFIQSSSAKPMTIASVEHIVDYSPRSG